MSDYAAQCAERGDLLYPRIYRIPNNNNTTDYSVSVDKICYRFSNVIKAIDISVKLHFVLNLQYNFASEQVYLMIQRHFFNLIHASDRVSPSLALLLRVLEKS